MNIYIDGNFILLLICECAQKKIKKHVNVVSDIQRFILVFIFDKRFKLIRENRYIIYMISIQIF